MLWKGSRRNLGEVPVFEKVSRWVEQQLGSLGSSGIPETNQPPLWHFHTVQEGEEPHIKLTKNHQTSAMASSEFLNLALWIGDSKDGNTSSSEGNSARVFKGRASRKNTSTDSEKRPSWWNVYHGWFCEKFCAHFLCPTKHQPGKHRKVPFFFWDNWKTLVLGVYSWWKLTATTVFQEETNIAHSVLPFFWEMTPPFFKFRTHPVLAPKEKSAHLHIASEYWTQRIYPSTGVSLYDTNPNKALFYRKSLKLPYICIVWSPQKR